MTYLCPKGHTSSEPDYCSECGIKIGAQATPGTNAAPTANVASAAAGKICPVCATPQTPGARFCEVCRYDFATGKPADAAGEAALAGDSAAPAGPAQAPSAAPPPAPPDPAPVAPSPSVAASPLAVGNAWAIVTADRSLIDPADAGLAFPEGEPKRSYPLDLDENLVGRRGARANLHPEIPINDPSVSSRHLKICRRTDGSLYLVDVGSTNGAKLNGAAIEAGVETPLKPGDQIVIGAWTRIVIEAR